jgi:hypothetical protein
MKVHLYLITSVLMYILGGKDSLVVPYVALVQHPKSRFNNNTRITGCAFNFRGLCDDDVRIIMISFGGHHMTEQFWQVEIR